MLIILSHFKMFRLRLVVQAIAICVFFLSHPNRGSRLRPNHEENESPAQDFLPGLGKRELMRLRFNSTQKRNSYKRYYARHQTYDGSYYGLLATMDVYGHELKRGQWTSTQIWVGHDGDGSNSSVYNTINVGWHIFPEKYGDSRPRFYTSWTTDGYERTGCFNMDCPGFIAAKGATVAPGAVINPASDPDTGRPPSITVKVFKDKSTGDWWVYYAFNVAPIKAVGYYPSSLFSYMANSAKYITFGAVASSWSTLPTPPMGNGALPNGALGHNAYFTDLSLVAQDGRSNPIMEDLPTRADNDKCYSITRVAHSECFYGGPGGCVSV